MHEDQLLFSNENLSTYLQKREADIKREIDGLSEDYILNVDLQELKNALVEKYQEESPVLKTDETKISKTEFDVEERYLSTTIFESGRSVHRKGTRISYFVPFKGNHAFFTMKPSTFTTVNPSATVQESELIINVERTDQDETRFNNAFNKTISEIKMWLDWVKKEITTYNEGLFKKIDPWVNSRWSKHKGDFDLTSKIGFPLKRREGAPKTYVAPEVRRKLPSISLKETEQTEPTVDMSEYEHVLSIIENMSKVMERSPKAFETMDEEALRMHFLMQLNAQYEGQATGETFNFEGKTDILVRIKNKNLFIAECKFWKGQDELMNAIDQLLRYTSWRDTKTAIILFNKNKNFSAVLKKIPGIVSAHPNFKSQITQTGESRFRFVLHQNNDQQRDIYVTIVAFDIPSKVKNE